MQLSGKENRGFFENPKVVFGFILVLVVAAVGLSAYQFANGIRGGFVPERTNGNTPTLGLAEGEGASDQLRSKDTDEDGLNDYDELYQYKTSPYLADTDSDGTGDKEEIDSGKDPNCPEGRSCKQSVPAADSETVLDNPLLEGVNEEILSQEAETFGEDSGLGTPERANPDTRKVGASGTNETDTTDISADLQQLTPAQIREALLESGKITKEQLDQITDEELMKAFAEVVGKSQ